VEEELDRIWMRFCAGRRFHNREPAEVMYVQSSSEYLEDTV